MDDHLVHGRSYREGYADGLRELIAQIEGTSATVPDGGYRGPVPESLTRWLERLKSRLDEGRHL